MNDRDRRKLAEIAATSYSPKTVNHDPALLRMAREAFIDGYVAALYDITREGMIAAPRS